MIGKLNDVRKTVFTEINELAAAHGALNLGQGFPTFPPDKRLIDILKESADKISHQYVPMAGLPELRHQLAEKYLFTKDINYDPDNEITIVPGATAGISTILQTFINSGDKVILIEPCFDCFLPMLRLLGAIPVFVPLIDGQIDFESFDEAYSPEIKMVIVNSPNNPTGLTLNSQSWSTLGEKLKDSETLLLSDEVYEHLVYTDEGHISAADIPSLAERSLIVGSFGKTFHITGWKIGYILAAENLTAELRKVYQYSIFSLNSPSQTALAEYMKEFNDYNSIAELYKTKRDSFRKALKSTPFKALPCDGTFFQCVDYSEISDLTDEEFCRLLIEKYKIAAIPMSPFYSKKPQKGIIRFCFAKEERDFELFSELASKISPSP